MNILSAGAAKGLLHTIAAEHGVELAGEYGAVRVMRERLLTGASCDVIVLTESMIAELVREGHVAAASVVRLGSVSTGVALPIAAAPVNIETTEQFRQLLANASRIYFPDPQRSTAGIHFMRVLETLGLASSHSGRFLTFANGATAMRALADCGDITAVGVTQHSEIVYTEGVRWVGALPAEFALATVYSAALIANATEVRSAERLLAALSAPSAEAGRIAAGFEHARK